MTVHYDRAVDALYVSPGQQTRSGVVEAADGVNVDTTDSGRIAGIEILFASQRMDNDTIQTYSIDLPKDLEGVAFKVVAAKLQPFRASPATRLVLPGPLSGCRRSGALGMNEAVLPRR